MSLTITDSKGNSAVLEPPISIAETPVAPVTVDVRPTNAIPNAYLPTLGELAAFVNVSMNKLVSIRNTVQRQNYLNQITGSYPTASYLTIDVLRGAFLSVFPEFPAFADTYALANAVVESNWYQWKAAKLTTPDPITGSLLLTPSHGDIGNGDSYGILQPKSRDNPPSYPLTAKSTRFCAHYRWWMCRAVYDGAVAYLGEAAPAGKSPVAGTPPYLPVVAGEQRFKLAMASWKSGWWGDPGATQYLKDVDAVIAAKPWTKAGFLR